MNQINWTQETNWRNTGRTETRGKWDDNHEVGLESIPPDSNSKMPNCMIFRNSMGNCFIISIGFYVWLSLIEAWILDSVYGCKPMHHPLVFEVLSFWALRSAFSPLSVVRFKIGCCRCVVDLDSLLQNFKITLSVFYLGCLKQPTFVPGCENVQYILFQLFHRDQPFH